MKKPLTTIITAITVLTGVLGPWTAPAHAITNRDLKHVLQDTPFYDPKDELCNGGATTIGFSSGPLIGGDNIEKAFNYFIQKGLSPEQSAGILGNLREESGVIPSRQQGDRSTSLFPINGTGYGIAQWTFSGRQDPLVKLSRDRGLPNPADLALQLDYMWIELNGSFGHALAAVRNTGTVADAAFQFHKLYEISADTMAQIQERVRSGEEVFAKYGKSVPVIVGGEAGDTLTGCTLTAGSNVGGAGAEGVIQTALSDLAWPSPACEQTAFQPPVYRAHCFVSTPAYAARGGTHTHPGASDAFTDCGIFVATVMRSGPDPSYPTIQTGTQRDYIVAHPEKYTVSRDPASLKPGDVVVHDGHTLIFVGNRGGGYVQVSASWHNHTPHRGTMGGVLAMFNHSDVVVGTLK